MSTFNECIHNNEYINNIKLHTNTTKDFHSLCYLIREPLSHGGNIKMGIALEKILSEYIVKNSKNLKNIKSKNTKGSREKDHLFRDDLNKIIYYAEIKSNLNLDTEKRNSTVKKVSDIIDELSAEHVGYKIVGNLVGLRYTSVVEIPSVIINWYTDTKVMGINDYLELLGVPAIENYVDSLNNCAEKIRGRPIDYE